MERPLCHLNKVKNPPAMQICRGVFWRTGRTRSRTETGARSLKGIQAVRSTLANYKQTAMAISLSPLASLCLGAVRGWVRVARCRRGGQIDRYGVAWTRLPASELRDQLAQEFRVRVSTRSVQRALKELAEANQVRREQRWKHRYKRDYWYTLPAGQEYADMTTPRTISGVRRRSQQRTNPVSIETTQEEVHFLSTQFKKTHFLSEGAAARTSQNQKGGRKDQANGSAREERLQLRRLSAPKGFAPTSRKARPVERPERLIGLDAQGRPLKEVWVGGKKHLVID